MFTQLSKYEEASIRKEGRLFLRIVPAPHLFKNEMRMVPHVIIFSGGMGQVPTILFKCDITAMDRIYVVENLEIVATMDEASLYFFVGWLLEEIESWAEKARRKIVIVKGDIPHITEWFVEHNYNIQTEDLMSRDRGYRGTKVTREASII